MLSEKAVAWLKGRKIDPAIAEAHDISSVKRGAGGEEWLVFPYQRDGRHVTNKYRRIWPEKDFSQDANPPFKSCFNEDSLKIGEGPVIITEGEVDALVLIQAGFERVLSVPDGAAQNEVTDDEGEKWSYIPGLLDRLKGEKEVILAVDGDEKGGYLRNYLAKRLGKARCKFLRYPDGTKDANDVLIKHGAAKLKEIVSGASWVRMDGLVRLKDMPPPVNQPIFKISLGGKESGYDKHFSFLRGQLSVGTGVPGHGKSAHAKAICLEMSRRHGWKFCVFSGEDDIQTDYRREVATYIANKPVEILSDADWEKADHFLDERFRFIVESEDVGARMTVEWLLERAAAAVTRFGADMIVVDPWSKLDHARDRTENSDDYVQRVLNECKRFARAFDVHFMIIAHPKKIEENKDGSYKIPGGYSISGSANWFNMPDLGWTAYRMTHDNGDTVARLVAWKIKRHSIMGRPGFVDLQLYSDTGRYSDYYDQGGGR